MPHLTLSDGKISEIRGPFKERMIEAIDLSRQTTKGGRKASGGWWPF